MNRLSLQRLACVLAVSCVTALGSAAAADAATIALGVTIANAPDQLAPMQSYANLAGAEPAIVMWYQQWSEPLTWSTQLPNVKTIGAIPMVTWEPSINGTGIPLSQIVAGKYDSYIKASADAAAAWKLPIYIRFAHEMNLSGSPWGPGQNGNTAAEFVDAWRHVVTIFRQERADNVEWVWSPNVYCSGKCPFTAFYPGDAWVDWVALDGYNYSSVEDDPWMTFAQIFGPSYSQLTALTSKPIMIAETASAEQGGNKAQWITQGIGSIPSQFPRIEALVWFDQVKETNWTVNSSPSSLAAWQSLVASPSFAGTPTTLTSDVPLASDVDSGNASGTPPAPPPTGGGTAGSGGGTTSSGGGAGGSGGGTTWTTTGTGGTTRPPAGGGSGSAQPIAHASERGERERARMHRRHRRGRRRHRRHRRLSHLRPR